MSITATLVDKMGTDLSVVNAARVSHGVYREEMVDRDRGLINFLAREKHVTPFRHVYVTLACEAPIFLARQLGKHQVGFSWNEISRRYKDGDAIEVKCYVPKLVLHRPDNLLKDVPELHSNSFMLKETIKEANASAIYFYRKLLKGGVAPEQARMVLPQSMITNWMWTGSLYGWFELYRQRSGSGAQLEARIFAEILDEIMMKEFPICWTALKENLLNESEERPQIN